MHRTKQAIPTSLIVAGTFLALALPVRGQDDRLRTLIYDPATKEWVEKAPPPAGTAEGDMFAIRALLQQKEFRQALQRLDDFVQTYGEGHELYPESLIRRGEALVGREEFQDAHEVLQTFLSEFRGMELTAEALRLEFVVAEAFLVGAKRRFLWVFWIKDVDYGYNILDEISTEYTDSPLAELALKRKGDHLASLGSHDLAEIEYGRMLREYPQSRYHQYALARTAESALASFGGIEFDEAALIEAEERYRDYQLRYPADAERAGVGLILNSIHEAKAEKEYQIAQYYERTEHVGSAVFYYRLILAEYPGTIAAGKAGTRLELLGAPATAGPPPPATPAPQATGELAPTPQP